MFGMQVWPIEVDLQFLQPVGRELKSIGKVNLHISDSFIFVGWFGLPF